LKSGISSIDENLHCIDLSPPIRGFENFISIWVKLGEPSFIVDTGPAVTADQLLEALEHLNIRSIDYILLTHIHMDHAGGVGILSEAFPRAMIVCHPSGIPQLVDPSRLSAATVAALGDIGSAYGVMPPVQEERLMASDQFSCQGVTAVFTPGHAANHISYHSADTLFAGEAAGVYRRISGVKPYLRPATPPRFFFDIAVKSIDDLIALDPESICYGHSGINEDAVFMLKTHKQQLILWKEVIEDELSRDAGQKEPADLLDRLLQDDPHMEGFHRLNPDMAARERFFLLNSVSGFVGFLKDR
jgi:glyoxylase-like metal-dependent hydrolase (beta-lactamase superfamily II)